MSGSTIEFPAIILGAAGRFPSGRYPYGTKPALHTEKPDALPRRTGARWPSPLSPFPRPGNLGISVRMASGQNLELSDAAPAERPAITTNAGPATVGAVESANDGSGTSFGTTTFRINTPFASTTGIFLRDGHGTITRTSVRSKRTVRSLHITPLVDALFAIRITQHCAAGARNLTIDTDSLADPAGINVGAGAAGNNVSGSTEPDRKSLPLWRLPVT